jgi:phage-related minor tail protein
VGGIQNIQKGGAGNVLSGIGSVLTTVGSIGMSVAGFMKPSGFGGPAAAGNNPWTSAVQGVIKNANGNAFQNGELMKFANGGILQSPTLFSFESAGVTRTGQAGEAGTEAIMPLKRTKDGRLGVEADLSIPFEGGSLMVDEEPPTAPSGSSSIPFRSRSGNTQQQPLSIPFMRADVVSAEFGGDAGDGPIKFESTVINNVEYVTRAEAEQIGRASAARGAELAQRRIKNNPQVRRSIGMSQ